MFQHTSKEKLTDVLTYFYVAAFSLASDCQAPPLEQAFSSFF